MNAPIEYPRLARPGWRASLELRLARRDSQTVPVRRQHHGPLRLLKGFHHHDQRAPIGCWEQIIVHPPGGVAAGDSLYVQVTAEPGAHGLLTSPGAAKWYRGRSGNPARQLTRLVVNDGAHLEWLPMENIAHDGCHMHMETHLDVRPLASLAAAEMVCLGRPAGDVPYRHGTIRQALRLTVDGQLAFTERGRIEGADSRLRDQAQLGEAVGFGTLLLVPAQRDHIDALVADIREELAATPEQAAVTGLPNVVIVRWRGTRADYGWRVLRAAWAVARPRLSGHEAVAPRIWAC